MSPIDDGFTMIELLVVIVILGVLATVVVFAVGGISDRGQENACAGELRTLSTAQEAHRAQIGGYGDETTLVAAGMLRTESSMFDVTAPGDGTYSVSPAAGSACTNTLTGGAAASAPATTAPPPPVTPTVISFGGIPAWQYGASGADEVLVLGRSAGEADWIAMINAAPPTSRRVTFINLDQIADDSDVDYVMSRSRTTGITDFAIYPADDTSPIVDTSGGTWPSVDAYMSTVVGGDPYHYLSPSGQTIESLLLAIG